MLLQELEQSREENRELAKRVSELLHSRNENTSTWGKMKTERENDRVVIHVGNRIFRVERCQGIV